MDNPKLLFDRSKMSAEEAEDVWDDSLLIKAYDRAISKIKKQFGVEEEESSDLHENKKLKKTKQSEIINEDEETKTSPLQWQVGDRCYATYSVDGLDYPAQIIEINENNNTCLVRYDYYDNEEEVNLDDLIEMDEFEDSANATTSTAESSEEKIEQIPQKKQKNKKKNFNKSKNEEQFIPPPPIPPALLSQMEGMNLNGTGASSDTESLYAMLMSWYMSGYHTGFYFGTQAKSK